MKQWNVLLFRAEKNSVPKASAAGAEQLERSKLTDLLEEQLNNALKKERKERAEKEGKPIHEIPTAEPLYLRMVVNTDKLQQVCGFGQKGLWIAFYSFTVQTFDSDDFWLCLRMFEPG